MGQGFGDALGRRDTGEAGARGLAQIDPQFPCAPPGKEPPQVADLQEQAFAANASATLVADDIRSSNGTFAF